MEGLWKMIPNANYRQQLIEGRDGGRQRHTNKPMVPFCLDEWPEPDHGVHVVLLDQLEELHQVVLPLEVELQGKQRTHSHVHFPVEAMNGNMK